MSLLPRRQKRTIALTHTQTDLDEARRRFQTGDFNGAFDVYEQLLPAFEAYQQQLLCEVDDCFQRLPATDRYTQYQSRAYEFPIRSGDKVLDIGSGNVPFPLATHLADLTLSDHTLGRGGVPFKQVAGKPVYECDLESLPFADKEFDFVYCSHVLEHVQNPERACKELMRVGKRGFVECPGMGGDLLLNTAQISHHRWGVQLLGETLFFTEYSPETAQGLGTPVLLNMHCAPQTPQERAFSAALRLAVIRLNVLMLWEDHFSFEVRRLPATGRSGGA